MNDNTAMNGGRQVSGFRLSQSAIKRIVITGGPCAGKTTAIEAIRSRFEASGRSLIIVDEVPTEIMRMGITFDTFGKLPFQRAIIDLQRKKEEVVMEAVGSQDGDVLVIYDRGIMDHFIYLTLPEQQAMEEELGIQGQELINNYDMVIHMLSVATELPDLYEHTAYRREDVTEARSLDERIGEIWQQHPCYVRIGCESDFNKKIDKLVDRIEEFLGAS